MKQINGNKYSSQIFKQDIPDELIRDTTLHCLLANPANKQNVYLDKDLNKFIMECQVKIGSSSSNKNNFIFGSGSAGNYICLTKQNSIIKCTLLTPATLEATDDECIVTSDLSVMSNLVYLRHIPIEAYENAGLSSSNRATLLYGKVYSEDLFNDLLFDGVAKWYERVDHMPYKWEDSSVYTNYFTLVNEQFVKISGPITWGSTDVYANIGITKAISSSASAAKKVSIGGIYNSSYLWSEQFWSYCNIQSLDSNDTLVPEYSLVPYTEPQSDMNTTTGMFDTLSQIAFEYKDH